MSTASSKSTCSQWMRATAGVVRAWLLVLALAGTVAVRGDHYSGASITYAWQSHPTLTSLYKVNLDLYLDCAGFPITPQSLYFSNACGVTFTLNNLQPVAVGGVQEVSQLCPSQTENSTCQGGTLPSFRKFRFEVTLNLSPCTAGPWKIEWFICCRNTMVNLATVPGTYAVATLQHQAGVTDRSPVFVDSGIPYVCIGQPVSYNPGATDPDGNLMSFALVPARFNTITPPNPTSVEYAAGFSGTSPFQGITIQAGTGQLNFTPLLTGRYVVVIEVTTFNSFGQVIGKVMRDLMFVVITCDESPPTSSNLTNLTPGLQSGPNSLGVCAGQSFCVDMVFSDGNPGAVIEVTSNATALLPGAVFTVTGTNPAVARLCWTGSPASLPANVFIQGDDGACPIANVNSRSILVGDCLSPLPITLADLSAHPHDGYVMLHWTTTSELDNEVFVVERGGDAIRFEEIGRIPGAGNSVVPLEYAFKDEQPLPGIGYYRLRQIDRDGRATTSAVVVAGAARGVEKMFLTAMADGQWWLGGVHNAVPWTIHELSGRLVATGSVPDGGGMLQGGLRSEQLYLLRITDSDGTSSSMLLPGSAAMGTTLRPGS